MTRSAGERTYYPRQLWNTSGDEWRPMMMVVVVVVVMITSAHGEQHVCDATKSVRCNGTSGTAIHLRLASSAPFEIRLHKEGYEVFRYLGKESKTVFFKDFNTTEFLKRWIFVANNWTLIINPAEKRDSGSYTVQLYNKDGKSDGPYTVELMIEGSASGAVLPAVVCVLVILVCLCVTAGVFYVRKNKHTRTAAQTPDSQGELHYADISVLAIHQRQQREAEKSQHTQEPVYSMVQHRS